MAVDRIADIKARYSVLEFARDVLGLPVKKSGDRCMSIAPGPHKKFSMLFMRIYGETTRTNAHYGI